MVASTEEEGVTAGVFELTRQREDGDEPLCRESVPMTNVTPVQHCATGSSSSSGEGTDGGFSPDDA